MTSAPAFAPEMLAILDKCKIPESLRTFLLSKDLVDTLDIKLIGGSEADVLQEIKDGIGRIQDAPEWDLSLNVKVKKLWTLCCQAQGGEQPGAAGSARQPSVDDEEALPDGMSEAIEAAWVKQHKFHPSGARPIAQLLCAV